MVAMDAQHAAHTICRGADSVIRRLPCISSGSATIAGVGHGLAWLIPRRISQTSFPDMSNKEMSDYLYGKDPDRLLLSENSVWYAFYDNHKSILTNVSGDIACYTYDNKTDYREIRSYIASTYPGEMQKYAADTY